MGKYMITYKADGVNVRVPQEIEADAYEDNGDWIDFIRRAPRVVEPATQLLRVRAFEVDRIQRVE